MGGEGSWVSVKNGSWHGPAEKGGLQASAFQTLHKEQRDRRKFRQNPAFCPSFFVFVFSFYAQAIILLECGHTCMFVCAHEALCTSHRGMWKF